MGKYAQCLCTDYSVVILPPVSVSHRVVLNGRMAGDK
jgi:hypothetical protein